MIARASDREPVDANVRDADRRFEMAITFDRGRVTSAARVLLDRML